MQKWLEDNDILMYSIHDEGNSVVGKSLIRSLNGKAYKKKMTDDNSKSYIGCLKLVYEYNNTNHHSIGKIPIHANCSAVTKKIEPSHKSSKFGDRFRINKYKNNFRKVSTKIWSREKFWLILCWKKNLWECKSNDLNGEAITESFYEKDLF